MVHDMEWKKNWKHPVIEHNKLTKFNYIVAYPDNLKTGRYFDIGAFSYLQAAKGIVIENDVEIGGGCHIYSETTIDMKQGTVTLKNNCKIGAHCVVMPGVTIGSNSVIGACSFVNKDIPADVIAYGTPCKVVSEII